jgi:hypothetical protein
MLGKHFTIGLHSQPGRTFDEIMVEDGKEEES